MSQENVENVRRAHDAFNRRDVDAALELLDTGVEMHFSLFSAMSGESSVYRGHEGARQFVRDLDDAFAEFQVEITEVRDLGDSALSLGHLHGRGKASGIDVESRVGYLHEFKSSKVTRIDDFLDPAEALKAAGLSE
jgi:ketosteroid isomerase-like protein